MSKHIRLTLRSQDTVSIESLAENEDDGGSEKLYANSMSEPEYAFFVGRRSDMMFKAFNELEYRERDIVVARLDFCMERGQVIDRDSNGLERNKEKSQHLKIWQTTTVCDQQIRLRTRY